VLVHSLSDPKLAGRDGPSVNTPVDGPSSTPCGQSAGLGLVQGAKLDADQGAAHEMSNLLQVVSGYLELLAARTDDTISRRYIDNAQLAARGLSEAIEELGRNTAGQTSGR
jgi:signal transduction histidine kinase